MFPFDYFKRRRRAKLLAQRVSPEWVALVEQLPLVRRLERAERSTLIDIAHVITAEKRWTGCGGLTVTEEMKWTIAAMAGLLILDIEHDYFATVHEVLIYPTTMLAPGRRQYGALVLEEESMILGQAAHGGPIVLAWDSVLGGARNEADGHNVVLHEFAHNLDFLDHDADGTPPLSSRQMYQAWHRIMTREYEALVDDAEHGRATVLDTYGATNAAEFFAVATEAYFEKPRQMREHHGELYKLLCDYYRQDPAARA
ncbi:MAG: hypothetical protein GC162_15925 [Planctomycetes bacterium]|nr:hypothetical protein [Planctomycetota bacterium]